jgi:hypothetical protein
MNWSRWRQTGGHSFEVGPNHKNWGGFYPDKRYEDILVILRGFIDESYSQKVFSLSCVMSKPSGWLEIESGWKKCLRAKNKKLRADGRKEISRYHAADCSSRVGDSKGWTVQEQISFTTELLAVFKRRRSWVNVISYSIPLDDFVREFPEYGADRIGFCYWTLVKFMMIEMTNQVMEIKEKKRSDTPVRFILVHDRSPFDGIILDAFSRTITDPTFNGAEMFSTIVPSSSADCIPLQAADLIAYENFKDTEGFLVGRKRRKTLEILLEMQSFGGRSRRFGPEAIKRLREVTTRPSGGPAV